MFEPGHDHLELLFEFGLGTGDGGPWKARMGDALDTPEQMVRGELRWAITHGMTERVRLLAEHGVDLVAPFADGITPAERAATTGHPDLVRFLADRGAPAPGLDPEQRFVAVALAAGQAALDELLAARPGLAREVRAARPALIVWAAAQGRPGSVADRAARRGLRDQRFGSTPLGWARYFGQEQLIELLEPLTAAEEPAPGDGSGRS